MSAASPWSPFRHKAFRAIWIAGLVSNIGNWMQNVGAAWLMTSLSEAVIMVALIQTASALPSFLLALPAGTAADLFDRRRLLLAAQGVMLAVSTLLSVATLTGAMTPWLLLGLTFALGCGSAFIMPSQQASSSDVVPQDEVPRAVVLSGISYNSARAVGPVLAGAIIAWAGTGAVFVANVLAFSVAIALLRRWKNPPRATSLPREPLWAGLQAGVRYVRHSPVMHELLLRSMLFVCSSSALWALLPIVARRQLDLGAAGYGAMLASLGIGSVIGGGLMPSLRRRLPLAPMIAVATVAFALATVVLACVTVLPLVYMALVMAGIAWILINATISGAIHTSVAHWVRGRALALHLLFFQSAMAVGAVLWGAVATYSGLPLTLVLAGASLLAGPLLLWRRPFVVSDGWDLVPAPVAMSDASGQSGTTGWVVLRICYSTRAADAEAFMRALRALGRSRLRNGALAWRCRLRSNSVAETVEVVEVCLLASWADWQRHQERRVMADQRLEESVHAALCPPVPPRAAVRVLAHRKTRR
ncbi:MAG: MFS transporter [Burkholderiales bacterium]|nr:MFS transporter [Burkholderiales bacterium]